MNTKELEKRVNKRYGIITYWKDGEMVYKQCSKCKEIKKVEKFSKRKNSCMSKCKECEKEYREENKERRKEIHKEWCKNNPDKVKEARKRYYNKNIEKAREWKRNWNKNNTEYIKETNRKQRENNPEYIKEYYKKIKEQNIFNINEILKQVSSVFTEMKLPIFGSIYKITHTNGHCYIGQTVGPLEHRYRGNVIKGWIKERKEKTNQKFLNELTEKEFTIEIIDYGICQYHLDKLEVYYINKFNSCDNGYNNNHGNHNTTDGLDEFNEILKTYNLQYIDGKIIKSTHP